MNRKITGAIGALTIGTVLALTQALPANAHVGIDPVSATPGGTAAVTFTVPNESETAATNKLEIVLPTDTPLVNVRYQPTPGWSGEIVTEQLAEPVTVGDTEITQASTRVIFTADAGGGIKPGQFEEFTLRLGPIPEVGQLPLPVVQTYDDGEVSNWSSTVDAAETDERLDPAPILYVNDEAPEGEHGAAPTAQAGAEHSENEAVSSGDGGLAVGLSISALVVAVLGAVLGALAFLRSRKRTV